MQLEKPMFCNNADEQGKECGETSGICLEIWHFAIQVQQLTMLKYAKQMNLPLIL